MTYPINLNSETHTDVQVRIEQGGGRPVCESCGLTQEEKKWCAEAGIDCQEPMVGDRATFSSIKGERK